MGATEEMVRIARDIRPHTAMLVPEGRQEVTTEGGLDVAGRQEHLRSVVDRLAEAGMLVSAFIDPEPAQVEAAIACGFTICEVHTGPYAHAFYDHGRDADRPAVQAELEKIRGAGEMILAAGVRFNAGHALNYHNVQPVAALPGISELHIGHSIVSRAIFTGMREAVREMKHLMREASRSRIPIEQA
jgi:pyridoxine 5-phosphate synthase